MSLPTARTVVRSLSRLPATLPMGEIGIFALAFALLAGTGG
ncbi:MAG TPA: hypothetical protein PKD10_10335 [Paracoccaceae bacterium]|nr:hypothetical protein [Paracoccaceae bacterium]HMO72220.1 hypothetical protein [Paracoccaceae bacterium]